MASLERSDNAWTPTLIHTLRVTGTGHPLRRNGRLKGQTLGDRAATVSWARTALAYARYGSSGALTAKAEGRQDLKPAEARPFKNGLVLLRHEIEK